MDAISNANDAASLAYLKFELTLDGRLASRYQLPGLLEGLLTPSFAVNHFQLRDFTPFHDEIRAADEQMLIGKWVSPGVPAVLLHALGDYLEPEANRVAFYYVLTRR